MGITEAQKIATAKHKKIYYKRIPLDVKKEEYNELKEYADEINQGVNTVIRSLINELLEKQRLLKQQELLKEQKQLKQKELLKQELLKRQNKA